MAYSRTSFTVKTNGQTLAVSATAPSGSAGVLHLTTAVSSAVTQPYTITSDTTFYVADELAGDYVLSAKQPDGSELYGKAIKLRPGRTVVVEPVPSALQVGADLSGASLYGNATRPNVTMRLEDTGTAVSTTTGNMRLVTFVGQRTETATKVRFITGSTAAAATPTLVRVGLFTVDTAGAGTLVASTANDTALAAAGNTAYEKAFSDSYGMVRGQLYALGILVVSAGQCPTLVGKNDIAGGTETTEAARLPRLCGTLGSQTDLPASYTNAGLSASASIWYGCVSA